MSNVDFRSQLAAHGKGRSAWRVIVPVLLILTGGGYYMLRPSTPAATVKYVTAVVTQGDLFVTVAASGTLEPTNVVTVGSELSGTASAVLVDINDRVKKGDLLVQLDPSKLNDAITKSQAALEAAQAGVRQAEATVAETKSTLTRLQELDKLSNHRLPAKSDMDSAKAAYERATANLASAQASVAQAQATLSSDKINLEKANIRSPIDGIVLSRSIDPGQTVAASLSAPTLFEIAEDLAKMELQVDVDEADVGQVKEGQDASFTVDAYPGRTYPAKVTRVSFGATTTDNVVTYQTTLTVDNSDLSLRPGMTASATISTQTRNNVLLVPAAALRFAPPAAQAASSSGGIVSSLMPRMPRQAARQNNGNSAPAVWVLENGAPTQHQVTKGASNGTLTEVSGEGLTAGQEVITGSSNVSK